MADHTPTGPVETGAEMDYPEHEKTYKPFLALAKYVSLVCVALLVAMAFGFFTNAGFFSATLLFFVICGGRRLLCCATCRHISPDASDLTSFVRGRGATASGQSSSRKDAVGQKSSFRRKSTRTSRASRPRRRR